MATNASDNGNAQPQAPSAFELTAADLSAIDAEQLPNETALGGFGTLSSASTASCPLTCVATASSKGW